MFRSVFVLTLCLLVTNGHPVSCKEDVHCSEGYYCEPQANVCQKCLQCQDFKRDPPKPDVSNECIKSIHKCGPCSEGLVNMYRNGMKGKCLLPQFLDYWSGSHYVYLWMIGAAMGLFIVATFVYDKNIKQRYVVRIVTYYDPESGTTLFAESSVAAML